MMKKGRMIEELEGASIIDKNLSIGAKRSKIKGLLNLKSIEVECKGKQSNVILTTQSLLLTGDSLNLMPQQGQNKPWCKK